MEQDSLLTESMSAVIAALLVVGFMIWASKGKR